MPTRPKSQTYTYKTGDNPNNLAAQFQTSPQALLAANPGGYPFSQGQTINIPMGPPKPFGYGTPQNSLGPTYGPPKPSGVPPVGYGPPKVVPQTVTPSRPPQDVNRFLQHNVDANSMGQTQPVQTLPPGQFLDNKGEISQGATPFGTNLFGQRLDASGNVWDPATATRDIYGGQFIQAGTKKWERVNGKLRQVVYGKGGKKMVIKGGGGNSPAAQTAVAKEESFAVSNAFVNFSLSSG